MTLIEELNITEFEVTSLTNTLYSPNYHFHCCMQLNDFHAQPQGYLNGGASLAFAEVTAGMASNAIGADKYFAVGQTITANHLNPTKAQGILRAQGQLLKNGKRHHVWEIKLFDEEGTCISHITVTNALLPKHK